MDQVDLSVIIPSRNEEFLQLTIEDILKNIRGKTEVIAVLDGQLPNPPLTVNDNRLTLIYHPKSVGQRAATNGAARIANGKYLMKVDAHCAFDEGFDVKMVNEMKDDWTMIPVMRNLHIYDWVCTKCGTRRYQGRSGVCKKCGGEEKKDIVWIPKTNPSSKAYRFDKTMHFQYYNAYKNTPEFRYGVILGYQLSFNPTSISPSIIKFLTDFANSHLLASSRNDWFRKNMPINTVSLSNIDSGRSIGSSKVDFIRNKLKVQGITTSSILANMINNWDTSSPSSRNFSDKPSVNESMCQCFLAEISTPSISSFINSSDPVPASGSEINSDIIDKFNNILGGRFRYNEKTKSFHNKSIMLKPIVDKELNYSMSIQGSCFMISKKKWFELDICSEEFYSWGQQGVEVACKTWLSGGCVVVNQKTWYAHMFRTQGGDFGFPYHNPQNLVNENREKSRWLFQKNNWPLAKRKFQWILDKFNPPDWSVSKGIIYYTHNQLDEKIATQVRNRLEKIGRRQNLLITSASLKKMDFGRKNIRFPSLKKNFLTMFKQILALLENTTDDIIFFCEHDVLYHPSHFDFTPPDKNTFYYNQNVWFLRMPDGHALHYDVNQLSGLCGWRDALLTHFRERYETAKAKYEELEACASKDEEGRRWLERDFNRYIRHMGFEPFTHNRVTWKNKFRYDTWKSQYPNIDIKHGANSTGARWKKEQYKNQNLLINWTETDDEIPDWGKTKNIVKTLQ